VIAKWMWALMASWALCSSALAVDEADLLPVEDAFVPTVTVDNDVATVAFTVAPGYYLYKERTTLEAIRPQEVTLTPLVMPEGEKKTDEFFGEMHVFHEDFIGTAKISYASARPLLLAFRLKYQGCADVGVCYPPQTRTFAMSAPVETVAGIVEETPPLPPSAPVDNLPTEQPQEFGLPVPTTPMADPVAAAPPADPLGLNTAPAPNALGPDLAMPATQDALPEEQAFRVQALATDGQTVLVRIAAPKDYYLYLDKFAFVLSADGASGMPVYPPAQRFYDEHFGDVDVYFGGVDITLKLTRTSAAPAPATLAMEFQGCKKDSVCYPVMRRVMRLELPSALATAPAVAAAPTVAAAVPELIGAPVLREAGAEVLPQVLTPGIVLAAIDRAVGKSVAAKPQAAATDVGLLVALLFALVGGVLLNLMPCVLPVLSLKVLGLVQSGNSPQAARVQAIYYTIGVLVSFFVLGLILLSFKSAGNALGWGFQLQNPLVVGLLAFLLIAMGLNLSGAVSFGHSFGNLGAKLPLANEIDNAGAGNSSRRSAFFNGVLACIVATPCTGPGMFTALGYGFTQSNTVAMLILLTLGLGLALPFLMIGLLPQLASRLPKPGAWMETLKAWLAFPLYLTAVWLLGVLGQQTGITGMVYALAGAVFLGAGLWWFERQRYSLADSTWLSKSFALALIVLAFSGLYSAVGQRNLQPQQLAEGQLPYSAKALAALRAAGKPVFVDMTAAWCITCKVNERNAINVYAVGQAMQQNDVAYMVGDYTNADPEITAYLKAYGAVGVPLYVMYPKREVVQ
jgi:thiol:disulfide interchange protein